MPKFINRADLPSTAILGGTLLAFVPVGAIYYVLLVLPFIPGALVKAFLVAVSLPVAWKVVKK